MVLEQKRAVAEVASNLGIDVSTLRYWIKEHQRQHGQANATEEKSLRKKVRELETENQRLRLEREILKKAAAFFAKEQQP